MIGKEKYDPEIGIRQFSDMMIRKENFMKKIGMIAAVEIDAVKKRYGQPKERTSLAGFDLYVYEEGDVRLYVLHTGAGEISAAAGTQALITGLGVELIVNFGVVGGLTDEMTDVRLCVVEKVVHYQFDTSAFDHCPVGQYVGEYDDIYMPFTPSLVEKAASLAGLKKVICASGDKFVEPREEKAWLHERFGADICEMEAAGIVKTANRNHLPCLSIKMVADSIGGGAEEYSSAFEASSDACLDALDRILRSM